MVYINGHNCGLWHFRWNRLKVNPIYYFIQITRFIFVFFGMAMFEMRQICLLRIQFNGAKNGHIQMLFQLGLLFLFIFFLWEELGSSPFDFTEYEQWQIFHFFSRNIQEWKCDWGDSKEKIRFHCSKKLKIYLHKIGIAVLLPSILMSVGCVCLRVMKEQSFCAQATLILFNISIPFSTWH